MSTEKVIIVGGGIAGSAVAIGLARRGIESVIIERQIFPRDKPCGEGLLPNGVERLARLGLGDLLRSAEAQPFAGIIFRCGRHEARGDFAAGKKGLGVRRYRLDALIAEHAQRVPGVQRIVGAAKQVQQSASGVEVELSDGRTVHGDLLVGADGPRSMVRHSLGLDAGASQRGRYGLRQHFRLADGVAMPSHVEVNALGGYELYLTPSGNGIVGLAALCERATMQSGSGDKAERLQELLKTAPEAVRARLRGATPVSKPLACGPLEVRAKQVYRGRALLVGDAAGYVDAITGEGMSLALVTAALAVDAIAAVRHENKTTTAAFANYGRQRREHMRDHVRLTKAVVFAARHPWLSRFGIATLARFPALFRRLLEINDGTQHLIGVR